MHQKIKARSLKYFSKAENPYDRTVYYQPHVKDFEKDFYAFLASAK